jgi:hypothetical protein
MPPVCNICETQEGTTTPWLIGFTLYILLLTGNCWAGSCYEASIVSPTPFMGNNGEILKLSDGSVWEVQLEYQYLYEYYPSVIICPDKSRLIIKEKSLNVALISKGNTSDNKRNNSKPSTHSQENAIETRVDGEFEGWAGDTIVKTTNGQIWQQSEFYVFYHYSYSPNVLIVKVANGYKMQVEGISHAVDVLLLK